jgi:hypothetical protein
VSGLSTVHSDQHGLFVRSRGYLYRPRGGSEFRVGQRVRERHHGWLDSEDHQHSELWVSRGSYIERIAGSLTRIPSERLP